MHAYPGAQGCGSPTHFNRRTLLKAAGLGGTVWMTRLAELLAREHERAPRGAPAKSVIVLWLQGGPSQLETFDPHPGTSIGGDTRDIPTAAPHVRIGSGLAQLADQMDSISLVRTVVSKEGDHERATYNMKTGFRPDPTLVHPAIGSVLCHQLADNVEIPRHISILPGQWPARGGYLGDQYDAFKIGDPSQRIPDIAARVSAARSQRRVGDLLNVVESEFARGRLPELDRNKTLHGVSIRGALKMMSSEQLEAFDVSRESQDLLQEYGETPFGRGCLVAVRLIAVGIRCVEVTLNGWDSHVNNHQIQMDRIATLDPAFAALIRDLKRRELLEQTIVLCGGEFGRTPTINAAGGRDHWPHGFSVALAGGGIRGGQVIGETSPKPPADGKDYAGHLRDHREVADIHATLFRALGIDFERELPTPVGRPMRISTGKPIHQLLAT